MKSGMVERVTDQVFIGLEGPEGQVLQVSERRFEEFYRLLGWEILGPAVPLPLYDEWGGNGGNNK